MERGWIRKVGGWTSVREIEACGCVRVMRGHSQDYQLKFLTVDAVTANSNQYS